jgi:hypothetical protein
LLACGEQSISALGVPTGSHWIVSSFFPDAFDLRLLLLMGAAAIALVYSILLHGWTAPVIAATGLTLLATLEYVNYCHRQLQHLSPWSDFKRLNSAHRLRSSHMARALAVHRRKRNWNGG